MSLFTIARIKFLDFDTNKEIFSLDGRWSTTGEPLQTISNGFGTNQAFDYSKVPGLRFEHILPGESSNLAVAVKIGGESSFYGFSNYSYAFDFFKNEEWKLDRDSCGSGGKSSQTVCNTKPQQ